MLNVMRKYATSWLIKILLGAIVVVFVLWGVGSYRSQRASRIALVNGEPITIAEYKETYGRILQQMRQQFGNNLNDDMIKMFNLKGQALDQLINKRLLLDEAKRLDFRVTDDELAQTISRIGAFQSAGAFDTRLYHNVLNLNRLTPEEFEVVQREAMLIERVQAYVEGNVKVSESEVSEFYDWQNLSIDIDTVHFDPAEYKGIQPTSAEIDAFFKEDQKNYETEPMVKVRYLFFDIAAFRDQIKVPESELRDYYDTNPEAFETPKTVEARHILFKVDLEASEEKVAAAKDKALEVLDKARRGGDFAELAKMYSEGPSKDADGFIGAFERKNMVAPFAEKAFSMKAGEISDPVRTRFGWHIIKVEKINAAATTPFDKAADGIRRDIVDDKARLLAYDAAEAAFEASYDGGAGLAEIAGLQQFEVQTTAFFARQGPKGEAIADPQAFAEAAFKLKLKDVSDIIDADGGYYLIELIDKKPPQIPPLETVRETVRRDLVKKQQRGKSQGGGSRNAGRIESGKRDDGGRQDAGRSVQSTGFFKRNQAVPGIGQEQGLLDAAFQLSETNKWPKEAIETGQGFFVIEFRAQKGG